MKAFLVLAVAVAGLATTAPAAHAIRECEALEIECHKTCTLPQVSGGIKDLPVYWVAC
jgi:hypothetical protein